MYWFVTHLRDTGTGLSGLIGAWDVNASVTGLVWDLKHFAFILNQNSALELAEL